jgi:hypothetical protein
MAPESRSPTRLFCGRPLWGEKPMLVPMATPLRMPVTELEPPRWQETTRNGLPAAAAGHPDRGGGRFGGDVLAPQSSAERSAMNLWLAPWKP